MSARVSLHLLLRADTTKAEIALEKADQALLDLLHADCMPGWCVLPSQRSSASEPPSSDTRRPSMSTEPITTPDVIAEGERLMAEFTADIRTADDVMRYAIMHLPALLRVARAAQDLPAYGSLQRHHVAVVRAAVTALTGRDDHFGCIPGWCALSPDDPRHEDHPGFRKGPA